MNKLNPYRRQVDLFSFWWEPILVMVVVMVEISACILFWVPLEAGWAIVIGSFGVYMYFLYSKFNREIAFEESFERAWIARKKGEER